MLWHLIQLPLCLLSGSPLTPSPLLSPSLTLLSLPSRSLNRSCNWDWEGTNNLALEVLRLLLEGCTTAPAGA